MLKKIIILYPILLLSLNIQAQDILTRYKNAEQWLPRNVRGKIFKNYVNANEIKNSSAFWYTINTVKGTEYILFDISKKKKKSAFNQEKLAKSLSEKTKKNIEAYELNIKELSFSSDLKSISFEVEKTKYFCNLDDYKLKELKKNKTYTKTEKISPDSTKLAIFKDHNIWIKNIETKNKFQLTTDGTEDNSYGGYISWYFTKNESLNKPISYEIDVKWSPDGEKLLISRYDRKNCKKLYLFKAAPDSGWRSHVYSYIRPIAGDKTIPTVTYYIADIKSKTVVKSTEPRATFNSYYTNWNDSSTYVYQLFYSRDWKTATLLRIDAKTGKSKILFQERNKTYIDPALTKAHILNNKKQALFLSERDGWNHIYLIDLEKSKIIRQITKGKYVVRDIKLIDEKKNLIYFTANGKEKQHDIYYEHLYVTDFKGKSVKLLTPENAYHNIKFLFDNDYYIDNYSTVSQPNKCVLRRTKDGKLISEIEEADISELMKMNWKAPEKFVVKGRDGKTDIQGVIYRPTNFDPKKKYPVIDGTYSGPHTIRTPQSFSRGVLNMDVALAELGFIVVTVDGFGSAFRSKKFHDKSFLNLGDIGAPDHITAIKQLAHKYPYFDTTRVGIYGHSAGGYDAVRALIAYNDFYSVAVSSAGNHDHRIAKAWWPELYMGYPAKENYDKQSNILNASKLKGHLMLAHGDMDQNVNPAGSLRMAAALTKANKDFELVLISGADHGQLWWNSYFIRKRWDFFVRYLANEEPPYEYKLNKH